MLQHILVILLCALLGLIVYEDFQSRMVHVWIFPVLFIFMLFVEFKTFDFIHLGINLSFLVLQFCLLTIYFSLKNKKLILLTQHYLGLGDIAFWVCLSALFSPFNFIAFFLISLFCSLILALLFRNNSESRIPLAGLQSGVLLILLLILSIKSELSWIRKDDSLLTFLLS